uniref:Uncharacterized protein n=1 Tax=Rhodnius prolixus TaxID=13249 RepID=T1I825_RHOPR
MELLSKGSKKKTTAVVLAVVLVAFIVAALVYFLKPEQAPVVTPSSSYINTKQGLTLESVIAGEFNPKTFNGSWVSENSACLPDCGKRYIDGADSTVLITLFSVVRVDSNVPFG